MNVIQSQIGRRHDAAVHLKSLDSLFIYRFAYLFVVKGDDRFFAPYNIEQLPPKIGEKFDCSNLWPCG